jgi:hypothetical protein
MSQRKELIFSPRFVGERFTGHTLPLEFLDDLQALARLNTEIAKWLFKERFPERKRVPRGFTDGISYAITGIEDGSACPQVQMSAPMHGMFPNQYHEFYQEAPNRLADAIQCLSEQGDPTRFLPVDLLQRLEGFGASLREDEHVEFRPNTPKPSIYSNTLRKHLLLKLSPTKDYTKESVVFGHIIDLNKDKLTFQLCTLSEHVVGGVLSNELYADFMDAFSEDEPGKRKAVQLSGSVRFNAYDSPKKIESVSAIDILYPLDLQWQIGKIALLEDGWFEGQGQAFGKKQLDALLSLFREHYTREDNPYLYPLPDGSISAEWENECFDLSLEIDLVSMKADYHSFDKRDSSTVENELSLQDGQDWGYLLSELETKLG